MGNTSLHTVIRAKWDQGIQELLKQGASPNQMSEPPTNINVRIRETPMHAAVRTGNMSYVTLMLKYKPDLRIRDRNNHTVFHLAAATRNVLILKQLLMEPASPMIIESAGKEIESFYHAALPLHAKIENEPQILKVIEIIYNCSDHINAVNMLGETPLYLACRLGFPNVVKFLLDNGADPVLLTHERQSTLHAACISGCGEILEHLLDKSKVSSLITEPDEDGNSPFYFAVEAASIDCCRILLNNGEHLTNICKEQISNCSLVLKKLPSAMQLFKELLNSRVTLNKKSEHDKDFSITFDYALLISEREEMQSSIISDLSETKTTLEHLIKHPLLESFLFLKWGRIKGIFYFNVIKYFLFVILHTAFVVITYGWLYIDWTKHEDWLLALKITHLVFILLISIPVAIITVANFKKILRQCETYTRLCAIALSLCVVLITEGKFQKLSNDPEPNLEMKVAMAQNLTNDHEPNREMKVVLASASMFFVWVELMMLLGRCPSLGTYILMLTKVSKSLIKFIMAFLSIIIGFSLCFFILFQDMPVFRTYWLSLTKTVMMMTGDISYDEFVKEHNTQGMPLDIFGKVVLIFFVFLVTIIISNLLTGLAVDNIPMLRQQGKIKKFVKQAYYIMAYERALEYVYSLGYFPARLRALLSSRFSINCVVTIQPNKKKAQIFYSQELPEETIKEAITLGNCASSEDFQLCTTDDVGDQLKGFQMRYFNDCRTQKLKFEVLCSDIKRDMSDLQIKLDKITGLLEGQMHQTQNDVNQI